MTKSVDISGITLNIREIPVVKKFNLPSFPFKQDIDDEWYISVHDGYSDCDISAYLFHNCSSILAYANSHNNISGEWKCISCQEYVPDGVKMLFLLKMSKL